ncbi:phosphopantetheine-binding protein [Owenweeksia hongkongensis]|uniref:Acyl carrier protein n=1 Tax=Owenweeksia hongkongensis (strain DSM 17368 / CIP 108786 / JCM 12287 / NRRL B-23963 / UST20020801) TaxID=926562 RepID=G8R636_OWEHD|nr:phosphopantetheine-binding protein [Owenweeksia hongkongensis]AEV32226.1 acyl carrier protein [Owenweeksia hongkongensis DSM 17368]
MENLEANLKAQIIEQLNLEELELQDFGNETPLFGDEGIGLDSIDALELIVLMEKDYNLKIANPEDGSKIFQTVNTMAEFIRANQ